MAHYCDTARLEQNWFNWLVAQATPCLDEYRNAGLLASKIIVGSSKSKKSIPYWGCLHEPRRSHCIMTSTPIYCNSYSGKCDIPRYFANGKPIKCSLPSISDNILNQATLDKVLEKGYIIEQPRQKTWDAMVLDINNMCRGISMKFNLPSEEAYNDLSSEALVQVISKVKNFKLVFTPGLAPVFNLLTTTIYRIIFSLLNKTSKDKEHQANHAKLIRPLATRGQTRTRNRITTKRIYGSLVCE